MDFLQAILVASCASVVFVPPTTGQGVFSWIKDQFGIEHCGKHWIKADFQGLRQDLKKKLYGQHLVEDSVISSVEGHWNNRNPQKALVLSFHGPTGVGKNYVSKIIANNLYKEGEKSQFFKLFVAPIDFPHQSHAGVYRTDLQKRLEETVEMCGRSVFVFDEVEKMPAGVIDSIKPFLDHHSNIRGVDYRQSIFIFLSNTGGQEITKKTLAHWKTGQKRELLQLRDIEPIVTRAVFNDGGSGLTHSTIIQSGLVNIFVPFLPLERDHVRLCIQDIARARHSKLSPEIENAVMDELSYFPDDLKVFSTTGCKRIDSKVDFVLHTRFRQREDL